MTVQSTSTAQTDSLATAEPGQHLPYCSRVATCKRIRLGSLPLLKLCQMFTHCYSNHMHMYSKGIPAGSCRSRPGKRYHAVQSIELAPVLNGHIVHQKASHQRPCSICKGTTEQVQANQYFPVVVVARRHEGHAAQQSHIQGSADQVDLQSSYPASHQMFVCVD